jgi:hypothetical protein
VIRSLPQKFETLLLLSLLAACGQSSKSMTQSPSPPYALVLLAPDGLAFADIKKACTKAKNHFCLENRSQVAVHMKDLQVVETGGSGDFGIVTFNDGAVPATYAGVEVGSGSRICFDVEHHPSSSGIHNAVISLSLNELSDPLELMIEGAATYPPSDDRFFIGPAEKVDIFFVIDTSPAMGPLRDLVKSSLLTVFDFLAANSNARIAFVPMDGTLIPVAGGTQLFVQASAMHARQTFSDTIDMMNIGASANPQHGLTSAIDGLQASLDPQSSFLRSDALRVLALISDQEDQSGGDVKVYSDFARVLQSSSSTIAEPIIGVAIAQDGEPVTWCGSGQEPAPEQRFTNFAQNLAGPMHSICAQPWTDAFNFIPQYFPMTIFTLSGMPKTDSLRVGAIDSRGIRSDIPQGAWHYDMANNAVVFGDPTTLPSEGSTLEADYETACP